MKDLIIVGASGFGRELLNLIETMNQPKPTWNVLGFIDDDPHALDGLALEHRILGSITGWQPKDDEMYALGIAAPKVKERIVSILKGKGVRFATIIAPTVSVARGSKVGEGVVIFEHTGISVNVHVGDFVFFNEMVSVGHDTDIGDYCTFGPKACISGKNVIGKCVNVGAMASTFPGIEVGDHATIGMGSAAIRRVKSGTTVVGVPARAIY